MLELKNIKKHYHTGDTVTKALDNVSVTFRNQEFVAILGPSGSGKTTMLNVIGGLDTYDSGDLIINGQSTKTFKDSEWDAYRNNSIGFVFQSYNLIGHLGIIDNVELGLTLSNVPKDEKRRMSEEALEKVGLKEHMHKKPGQLSGGQMQRVAIARALATNPDVLLCDEPTGALDSKSGKQIMDLIKELSKEKLVIMVTHDDELARKYADRIVSFKDGQILGDTNPYDVNTDEVENQFKLRKTKMSFWTALKLSMNNLRSKVGQTFLTAFASSIGIISIGIVLALSNGFQIQIEETQSETLAQFPITVGPTAADPAALLASEEREEFPNQDHIVATQDEAQTAQHKNLLTEEYVNYVENIDPELTNGVSYARSVQFNMVRQTGDDVVPVSFSASDPNDPLAAMNAMTAASTGMGISTFPTSSEGSNSQFLESYYDVLEGGYPASANDVVLVVESDNTVNVNALRNLGFDIDENEEINYKDIIGTEIEIVNNDDYYQELPTGTFMPNTDSNEMIDKEGNITVRIAGVLRPKEESNMPILAAGIAYSDELSQEFINANQDSEIVMAQNDSSTNVLTGQPIEDAARESLISGLGGSMSPTSIYIYPSNFEAKDSVLNYLDSYNDGQADENKVVYTDLAGTMTALTGGLMDAITYALVAFAAISLVTSIIMIAIITYTSVVERTKEIGVLKALGARKKDITRVFDAETFILGISSGILGIVIAYLVTIPLNMAIYSLTGLSNVAQLDPVHAVVLVLVSTILTVLGGHIPARMAAKRDAAVALRAD